MVSVYHEIEDFFAWNPTPLEIGSDHVPSKNTRPPCLFDKHLDDSLILKHLVHLPSLPNVLGNVTETAFTEFRNRCKAIPQFGDFTPDWVEKFAGKVQMKDESTVVQFYRQISEQCAAIASTLALTHEPAACESVLDFTQAVGGTQATSDGTFRLFDSADSAASAGIDDEKKAVSQMVIDVFSRNIGLLEFKNLKAGKEQFMKAVEALAHEPGFFPWQPCVFQDCGTGCKTKTGLKTVKGARMGFDALSSPWASSVTECLQQTQEEDPGSQARKRNHDGS